MSCNVSAPSVYAASLTTTNSNNMKMWHTKLPQRQTQYRTTYCTETAEKAAAVLWTWALLLILCHSGGCLELILKNWTEKSRILVMNSFPEKTMGSPTSLSHYHGCGLELNISVSRRSRDEPTARLDVNCQCLGLGHLRFVPKTNCRPSYAGHILKNRLLLR